MAEKRIKALRQFGEKGQYICGPVMDNQGRVNPGEGLGQQGNAAAQSALPVLPKGGGSTAPPKDKK